MIYNKNQWFSNFKYKYQYFAFFSFAKTKKKKRNEILLSNHFIHALKNYFFRKIDFYVKLTVNLFISRRNVNVAQCGNYGILLPPCAFFRKNSVKVTFYEIRNLTQNWFDEKKFAWQRIFSFFHSALWRVHKFP